MPTNTWVALKSTTVGTATPTITFTGIPSTYTDLILMSNSKCSNTSTGASITIRFNSDSAGNYSQSSIQASSTSRITERYANTTGIDGGRINTSNSSNSNWGQAITHIQNYASTSYQKLCLSKSSVTNEAWKQYQSGSLWRNSANAINTITITCGYDFLVGSTFSLYGVKAWANESTPKATGGQVFQDSTYWYHAFLSTGTFTPSTALTNVEFVVVAGGGGGGENAGSPGGAGGFRSSVVGESSGGGASAQSRVSMNSGTAYTITVGGGGAGNAIDNGGRKRGAQGSTSSITGTAFTTVSCTGGGYGTTSGFPTPTDSGNGGSGGSGGGGTGYGGGDPNGNGGSGTTGEGYGGGAVSISGSTLGVGGGGGAGAAGGAATIMSGSQPYAQGNGGIGVYTALSVATNTGEAGYLAGGGAGGEVGIYGLGGGGGPTRPNYHALANTGGGGGAGGAGGSGIVILRYTK